MDNEIGRYPPLKSSLGLRHGVFADKATCRCVVAMAEATLEETERKLRETRRFAASLRKHLTQWKRDANKRGGHAADFCKLIETSWSRSVQPYAKASEIAAVPTPAVRSTHRGRPLIRFQLNQAPLEFHVRATT